MKHPTPIVFLAPLAWALFAAFLTLPGCAANDPTVVADGLAIKNLQAQIAATTQPAELPALQAQLVALQEKEQADMTTAETKISTQITKAQGVTNTVGTVAASTGTPWGAIVAGVLGVVSVGLGAYANNQSNKASAASAVIAAAAPGVAQLVKQATDNQTLAGDITTIGQVGPGVISLLSHPAATTAVAAAAAVSPEVAAAVVPSPAVVPVVAVPPKAA